jgi:hypothetical protein
MSAIEVEMVIEKLKGHKSPGIDHIPAKLINPPKTKIKYSPEGPKPGHL